jgi:hypothetical protein
VSTPDRPIPADQWQNTTQPDTNAVIQNCPCPICSRTRYADNQTASGTIEYHDRTLPVVCTDISPHPCICPTGDSSLKEPVVLYADQNVGTSYPTDITAAVDFPTQEWSFVPQALVRTQILCSLGLAEPFLQQYQETAEYAPWHEAVDSLQVEMGTAPYEGGLDLSAPERLRRLAGRYVNDPESLINGVHLEPGPSGRFQIVITIEIGDILGDTID